VNTNGTQNSYSPADATGRLESLKICTDYLANLVAQPSSSAADALSRVLGAWLTDASLANDAPALEGALGALQVAHSSLTPAQRETKVGGIITAFAEIARAAADRAFQETWAQTVDANSWAAQMLLLIAAQPNLISTEILQHLRQSKPSLDETQVSRSGRTLLQRGLATAQQLGRTTQWRTTPRGAHAVTALKNRSLIEGLPAY